MATPAFHLHFYQLSCYWTHRNCPSRRSCLCTKPESCGACPWPEALATCWLRLEQLDAEASAGAEHPLNKHCSALAHVQKYRAVVACCTFIACSGAVYGACCHVAAHKCFSPLGVTHSKAADSREALALGPCKVLAIQRAALALLSAASLQVSAQPSSYRARRLL